MLTGDDPPLPLSANDSHLWEETLLFFFVQKTLYLTIAVIIYLLEKHSLTGLIPLFSIFSGSKSCLHGIFGVAMHMIQQVQSDRCLFFGCQIRAWQQMLSGASASVHIINRLLYCRNTRLVCECGETLFWNRNLSKIYHTRAIRHTVEHF